MQLTRLLIVLMTALALLAAPAEVKKGGKKEAAPAAAKAEAKCSGMLDLNSATVDQLKGLPGIGDAYSAAIVKNRPYGGKDEIVTKAKVPQATYDKIKDCIIAKQSKKK